MSRAPQAVLSARARADLYAQLATLEDAGLPASQALTALAGGADRALAAAARRAASALNHGQAIALAGERHGLFARLDAQLIAAAGESGRMSEAYRRLAERYRHLAERLARIRARCLMPVFVGVLALIVAPLPALVGGQITPGGFVVRSLGTLVVGALLVILAARGVRWIHDGGLAEHGLGRWLDRLNLSWPLLGPMNGRRGVLAFLDALGLALEAGLPADRAVENALGAVRNYLVREDLRAGAVTVAAGGSLSDVLAASRYVSAEAYQLAHSGEQAGRLADSLLHFARFERERIDDFDDQLAAWAPRVFYFLVVGWIASGWISTGLPMPAG